MPVGASGGRHWFEFSGINRWRCSSQATGQAWEGGRLPRGRRGTTYKREQNSTENDFRLQYAGMVVTNGCQAVPSALGSIGLRQQFCCISHSGIIAMSQVDYPSNMPPAYKRNALAMEGVDYCGTKPTLLLQRPPPTPSTHEIPPHGHSVPPTPGAARIRDGFPHRKNNARPCRGLNRGGGGG